MSTMAFGPPASWKATACVWYGLRKDPAGPRRSATGWKLSYCGKERSGCWSGRIRDEQGNNLITPIDVTSPSNILGKYVCYNYKSGAVDWANVPKGDPEWGCWHVADDLTSTGEYGPYTLSPATRGDIVIGASGLPTPTTENYVLTVNQVWNDSTHDYELKWEEGVVRAI